MTALHWQRSIGSTWACRWKTLAALSSDGQTTRPRIKALQCGTSRHHLHTRTLMSPESPIMTVLEGPRAGRSRSRPQPPPPELNRRYNEASGSLPPQMLQALLVQSNTDPAVWRGISVWRSRVALEEYRRSVTTPAGIRMFQAVGAQPSVSMWDVAALTSSREPPR